MHRLSRVIALTIAQAADKMHEPLPVLSHGTWLCRDYLQGRGGIFRFLSSLFAEPGNQLTRSKASS